MKNNLFVSNNRHTSGRAISTIHQTFFTPVTPFGVPPLLPPAPIPQPPLSALLSPPNVANMIASLVGSMWQPPLSTLQRQFGPANPTHVAADLANLLNATLPPKP